MDGASLLCINIKNYRDLHKKGIHSLSY